MQLKNFYITAPWPLHFLTNYCSLKSYGKVILFILLFSLSFFSQSANSKHPNVLLILTDDQGFGDLGFAGNLHVKTPEIDQFAKESIRFTNFLVSPVCAPTRSSLMTGRFSLRTGIRDTYNGGAIMASDEVTIAEMLKEADYSTGIFGKWHLGDNYPFRPGDQGFDESLIHLSGGMGQPGDFTTFFKNDSSYFDPVLWHNNQQETYKGYCSDIFAENAIHFIEKNKDNPFFCYLAFNAPHSPLQVPEKYYAKYKDIDPSAGYSSPLAPEMNKRDKENARKVYAMVDNLDENIGRILGKLDELKIAENTIVIFMTDNGPANHRYLAGMRGKKGAVYQGGVRVPFFIRYPDGFEGDREIETLSAHIDVLPTLADLCQVALPANIKIDGENLVPVIQGEKVNWEDRLLFFYWNRRYPELYSNMAVQRGDFKLVGHTKYDAEIDSFELYNVKTDPAEQRNLVGSNTQIALEMKAGLDRMCRDLIASPNLQNPMRIIVGSENENPVFLNRNDAAGQPDIWTQDEIFGLWNVNFVRAGKYNFRFKFIRRLEPGGTMCLETKMIVSKTRFNIGATDEIELKNISLPQMECELIPFYSVNGKRIFPLWVEIERVNN